MSESLQTRLFNIARGTRQAIGALVRGWREEWARGADLDSHPGSRAMMNDAAQQSAWVFRCLQLIAGPVRALDLEWYEARGKGQVEVDDTDLHTFWRRPAETVNGRLSFGDFIELTLDWINIKGQAFWVLDDTWLMRGNHTRSPIILARADRMTPIKHFDTILGWRFVDGAGNYFNLLPQQVIRPRILNPHDDARGLAPLEAGWIAATADHAAGVFSRNLSQSNGDQGVYVISKGAALTDEQRTQIIAQLRQKAQLAKSGDYRAAFLTADVAIEDAKVRAVDEAFIKGRDFSRDEIAVAFGVPPSMLSLMQSYSIGAASDRYRLIEETCIPHSARVAEAMELVELLRSGRDLKASFDWDDNTVMAQARNEKLKAAAEVWKCGIPWSVLNDNMELGLDPFPGSDRAWLPMSLETVDGTTNDETKKQTTPQLETSDDTAKTLTQQRSTLGEMMRLVTEARTQTPVTPETKANDKRRALWQKHMKARGPAEKLFKSKFNRCVMDARKETLAKIEKSEKNLAGARERGVLDLMFDLAKFTISLVSEMNKAHRSTLDTATQQFLEEIGRPDDPWKMESTKVMNYLTQRDNLIRDAAKEVYKDIQESLQEGLKEGETTAQLAARVRTEFNGISDERAAMIATTETGAAYGAARHDAIEGLDIPYKQWLSAQDDRVRDTHVKMDEVTVSYDEPFHVPTKDGGEDLMQHPCDAEGSAENCIHCRCIELPMMEEDVES